MYLEASKLKAKYEWSISRLKWQDYTTSEFPGDITEIALCRLCLGAF